MLSEKTTVLLSRVARYNTAISLCDTDLTQSELVKRVSDLLYVGSDVLETPETPKAYRRTLLARQADCIRQLRASLEA